MNHSTVKVHVFIKCDYLCLKNQTAVYKLSYVFNLDTCRELTLKKFILFPHFTKLLKRDIVFLDARRTGCLI